MIYLIISRFVTNSLKQEKNEQTIKKNKFWEPNDAQTADYKLQEK